MYRKCSSIHFETFFFYSHTGFLNITNNFSAENKEIFLFIKFEMVHQETGQISYSLYSWNVYESQVVNTHNTQLMSNIQVKMSLHKVFRPIIMKNKHICKKQFSRQLFLSLRFFPHSRALHSLTLLQYSVSKSKYYQITLNQ